MLSRANRTLRGGSKESKMDMNEALVLKELAETRRIEALTDEVKANIRLKESQIALNEKELARK